MTTTLKWTTVVNGAKHRAQGRYPGWRYEITKDGHNTWYAWFIDENNKRTELVGGRHYREAKAAAVAHHNHPGH